MADGSRLRLCNREQDKARTKHKWMTQKNPQCLAFENEAYGLKVKC